MPLFSRSGHRVSDRHIQLLQSPIHERRQSSRGYIAGDAYKGSKYKPAVSARGLLSVLSANVVNDKSSLRDIFYSIRYPKRREKEQLLLVFPVAIGGYLFILYSTLQANALCNVQIIFCIHELNT